MPNHIVKLDNNWELLLALNKGPKTKTQLDSLGIKYTNSQLKLLKTWELVDKNEKEDSFETSVVLLDSTATLKLRNYSGHISKSLVKTIYPSILELNKHLDKINRTNSAYTILFSYVLDGISWDYFIKEDLVEERVASEENPFWAGEFWSTYPHREFSCGTNTAEDRGFSMCVNWSEIAIPNMIPFVSRFDLQFRILDDYIEHGRILDKEALEVFAPYNFFDDKGNLSVPVIAENDENEIYILAKSMAEEIAYFVKNKIDWDDLIGEYGFRDTSQALIILYHEIMWDMLEILEKDGIIEKPIAFRHPHQTKPENISDLIFFKKE